MKTIAMFVALILVVLSARGQDLTQIQYKQLKFYNESGTLVTAIASGDTLASEWVPLYLDANYNWSMNAHATDTIHANVYYQMAAGQLATSSTFPLPLSKASSTFHSRNNGFYATGVGALSALQDSIAVNGLQTGTATGCRVTIPSRYLSSVTSVASAYVPHGASFFDSVRVNTYTYTDPRSGYHAFRIVLIGYVGQGQVGGEPTILNNNVLRIEPAVKK